MAWMASKGEKSNKSAKIDSGLSSKSVWLCVCVCVHPRNKSRLCSGICTNQPPALPSSVRRNAHSVVLEGEGVLLGPSRRPCECNAPAARRTPLQD